LQEDNTKLFAKIELTQLGAEKLARGEYKYFSPEIIWQTTDDETGEPITNLLIG
jgi:phage I-like protein